MSSERANRAETESERIEKKARPSVSQPFHLSALCSVTCLFPLLVHPSISAKASYGAECITDNEPANIIHDLLIPNLLSIFLSARFFEIHGLGKATTGNWWAMQSCAGQGWESPAVALTVTHNSIGQASITSCQR
jgi:hypothetical protein